MDILENIKKIKNSIPENVKLIAVSKFKSVEDIQAAYDAGQRCFGENKAQEMSAKYPQLPQDIEWHFIGHLQTNKVKYIVPFVTLIHSVDNYNLLKIINKEAIKNNRIIDCLLQFHIAEEETKFGFNFQEVEEMLKDEQFKTLQNIRICGVMGMATFTDDQPEIRKEFSSLKSMFYKLKIKYFAEKSYFKELSMGMSDDYLLAIEEGSTMIRVGSAIFGARNYQK
ncbi:MAG: YggS family pyridoxal phosphate-dependent enzyme [Bacteroidales bacterium]|nr:YggS family pyridoxal phosphate-dependent enzyme [Bacteroidales bacterium]